MLIIVGDEEVENRTVSVRKRDGGQQNDLPLVSFIAEVKEKVMVRTAVL